MEKELRPFWNRIFHFDWKFGLFLILIICISRFILVLHANASGNYSYIGLIMIISAILPFMFLGKYGRQQIGIAKPKNRYWLLAAFVSGLAVSVLLHFLAQSLYGSTYENWYYYIGKSYNIPANITKDDRAIMFAIMAITGMIFSPIGEELFFRGIVHSSFARSIGDKKASLVDSSAFALTHISHFGWVFINDQWDFFTVPTLIWVLSMFSVSILFFLFKKYSGSILGAIICHAAFNLGMIYCIFYLM
ncbi:MAG: type II CAAX endopeptidase family protein [Ferruginibacter sp.]